MFFYLLNENFNNLDRALFSKMVDKVLYDPHLSNPLNTDLCHLIG